MNAIVKWRPAVDSVYCYDAETFLSQMDTGSVNCTISDPPYGIGDVVSAWRSPQERFADVANNDRVYTHWLKDLYRVQRSGGAIYIFASWRNFHEWSQAIEAVGFKVRDCIVWDKVIHGLSGLTTHYAPQHEFVLYAVKDSHHINWPRPTNVLRYSRVNAQDLTHPYEKPVALIERLLQVSTQPGDVILDPFMGSGTTAIAARNLKRHYIGCDISPLYVQLAHDRLHGTGIDRLNAKEPAPITDLPLFASIEGVSA